MTVRENIRPLALDELALVSALALRAKAYWGYSPEFLKACEEELSISIDEYESDSIHFFVLELRDDVVGYYAIRRLTQNVYELDALFVEPSFIGKGFGGELMQHAKEQVRGLGGNKITLQSDPNAEQFYLAAGGCIVGKQESESIRGRYLSIIEIELCKGAA
ncbi:MAG: GNAT family N-acetyltransferase [Pseudomonadota bacterium]